jgi:hypothetical protein
MTLEQAGLVVCTEMKPLIRGDQLQKSLELPKGPSVGIATQCLLRLQMAHPTYSEEQLMHCMSAHVADIKAEAAVKRSKS